MTTKKAIALTIWSFVSKVMSLLINMLSRFVIAFLPRSKHVLISWLQSLSAVILEPKKIKSATVLSSKRMHNVRVWVKFYLGQNVDSSLGFSTTNSSKRLLQRYTGGRSIHKILVKEEFSAIKHTLQRFSPSHREGTCCRKGEPFQGQKVGFCLTLRNELTRRHRYWQSKRFYWKGAPGWRIEG